MWAQVGSERDLGAEEPHGHLGDPVVRESGSRRHSCDPW